MSYYEEVYHHGSKSPRATKKSNGTPTKRSLGAEENGDSTDPASRAVAEHVQGVVNVYSQIAANPELQKLRTHNRGLFDSLLQHAVPFALNAASSAIKTLAAGSANRAIGDEVTIHQHLPTAINFAQQINAIPEVQGDRGLFDKIFSIGMPLVLNTAQTLLGAKRGLETPKPEEEEAQRGFFDAIIGQLPSTVFNILSDVAGGKRDLGDEERGFFDVLKKVAPIVLNVASSAVNSLAGQRSLSFTPTDRGFFDSLKNVVGKVVSNPLVQKIGSTALDVGIQVATNALSGKRSIGEPEPTDEQHETQVRGFFGSLVQHLTPIAIGALQGAVGAAAGKRAISIPQKKTVFDIVAQNLPGIIQTAQARYNQNRSIGGVEDDAAYLQRVLATTAGPIVQAAREQTVNPSADRGILGSILGSLVPF